ncbi:family 78 glycoside hydrolase catalytic domain [Nonomuraea sp. NPDC049129]|uniref:alpha-L-rhamnosidase n=1 Tax=Nonomuraea sp. NPDC049129 TaxID=3155272 RepID=UPI0033D29029
MRSATPTHLTVERLVRPHAVWTRSPQFGWHLGEPVPGAGCQSAYELEVRTAEGEVIAATGKVGSAESHSVVVPGLAVPSRTRFLWRVRIWAGEHEASEWAESWFETTILDASEWTTSWIEPDQRPVTPEEELAFDAPYTVGGRQLDLEGRLHPSPLVRQRFELDHLPERARLYISAHGMYEVTINGRGITDEVLAPGYDEHPVRLSFQTYDATPYLRLGENVVGVRLADGWWAGRISFSGESANYGDKLGVIWQLEGDGQHLAASGASARSSFGEIRYSDLHIGEMVDARLAIHGWDEPGFDDAAWSPVDVVGSSTAGLVPHLGEPVRRVAEIDRPAILTTPSGELIVDLGQNIAGRLRLTARGEAGTTIVLEHTESLDRDGNFHRNVIGRNKDQTDVWILAGTGVETFEPRFTFHGFRFVCITGYPGQLTADDVVGVVTASDLQQSGRFVTDDARINRLHQNVTWSQRGNFLSIPTDCPSRERAGWTADIQIFARAATNNARVDLFLERWLANVRAAQSEAGIVPTIVPNTPSFAKAIGMLTPTSAGWGDAITMLPLALYERYGDPRVLADNYEAMLKWVGWVRERAENDVAERYQSLPEDDPVRMRQASLWNTGFHFGDWLVPSTVTDDPDSLVVAASLTGELFASAFYYHSVSNLARVAEILEDRSTVEQMRALAARMREAFGEEFLLGDGRLTVHMQGAYVIALAFGLIPAEQRDAAARNLADLIHEAHDHLDTGFLSTPYLLDVLAETGHRDLAYRLLLQDTVPSWLYEVAMGATTIWESWGGVEPDGQPRQLSLNHYALGAVDDWMFRNIAGLRPAAPGYSAIEMAPDLAAPFTAVAATIGTPFGDASIEWKKEGGQADITMSIPANTTAVLRIPGLEPRPLPPGQHTVSTPLA